MKALPLLLPHYSGQLLLISMDSTRNFVAYHNGPEIGQNQTDANSIGLILAHFWPCCYHLSYSDLFLVHAANISLILAHFWPMLPVSVWNWPISGPCCQCQSETGPFLAHAASVSLKLAHFWSMLTELVWLLLILGTLWYVLHDGNGHNEACYPALIAEAIFLVPETHLKIRHPWRKSMVAWSVNELQWLDL